MQTPPNLAFLCDVSSSFLPSPSSESSIFSDNGRMTANSSKNKTEDAFTHQSARLGLVEGSVSPTSPGDRKTSSIAGTASRRRTTRACEGCRKKKIACNGKQPCTACTLRNRDCVYTTLTVTGRPSKGAVRLLQRQIEGLEEELARVKKEKVDSSPVDEHAFLPQLNRADPQNKLFDPASNITKPTHHSEAVQHFSEQNNERYGVTGLDAVSGRSTNLEEDFMLMARDFSEGMSLTDAVNDEQYRRQMDLHTSFRLERRTEGEYVADSGWFLSAFRLEQCLSGIRQQYSKHRDDADEEFKYRLPVPNGPEDQHPEMQVAAHVNLYWPSREREDQMMNVYFRLVHPMLPILCKETLDAQRKGPLRSTLEGDSIWLSIMLGVFISAARYMPSENENMLRWWNARSCLDSHHIAHARSIGGVQNFLLSIAVRSSLFVAMHFDLGVVGLALRSMQERGLHRECVLTTKYSDQRYVSIIRCLWWTAQRIDVDRCAWSGHNPTAISFDVLPPRNHTLASPIPYFNASLKGLPMLARIKDRTYMVNRAVRMHILRDVNAWLAELLEFFAFMSTEKDDEKIMASSKLWLFTNMVVSFSRRPAILLVSRKLRVSAAPSRAESTEWTQQQHEDEEVYMRDFEEAQQQVKDAMKRTVVIIRTLVQRGTDDISFMDDETAAMMGATMLHGCLLYFTESMISGGRQDGTVLQCLDEVNQVLEQCRYPGALFKRACIFMRSMTRQVRMHAANLAESRRLQEKSTTWRHREGQSRPDFGSAKSSQDDQPGSGPNSACFSSDSAPTNVKPEREHHSTTGFVSSANCLSEGRGGRTESSERLRASGSYQSSVTEHSGPLHEGYRGSTAPQFDPQGWFTDHAQVSNLEVPTTSQNHDEASPESRFWQDLLNSELMMVDTFGVTSWPADGAQPTELPLRQEPRLTQEQAAQRTGSAQQNATGGTALPFAAQATSFWLGPVLEHELSPPKT